MVHDFPKQWLLWSRWWIVFRSKRKKGECVCLFDPTVWPLIYHLQKLRQLNASWTLAFSTRVNIFFAKQIILTFTQKDDDFNRWAYCLFGVPKIHANQIQPKVGDETKINRRMCLDCRPDKICPSSSGDPSFSKSRSKNDFLLARISFFSVPPSKDEDPFFREAESSRTHIMQKSLGKFFVLLPSDQMIRHLSRGGRKMKQ